MIPNNMWEEHARQMLGLPPDGRIPTEVTEVLEYVDDMLERAGGRLRSRQIVAILLHEVMVREGLAKGNKRKRMTAMREWAKKRSLV